MARRYEIWEVYRLLHYYGYSNDFTDDYILLWPEDLILCVIGSESGYECLRLEQPWSLKCVRDWAPIAWSTTCPSSTNVLLHCDRLMSCSLVLYHVKRPQTLQILCSLSLTSGFGQRTVFMGCSLYVVLRYHQSYCFVRRHSGQVIPSPKNERKCTHTTMMKSQKMNKTRGLENHTKPLFTIPPLSIKKRCGVADSNTVLEHEHKKLKNMSNTLSIGPLGVTSLHLSRKDRRAILQVPIKKKLPPRVVKEVFAPITPPCRLADWRKRRARAPMLVWCKYHKRACERDHTDPSKYRSGKRVMQSPASSHYPIDEINGQAVFNTLITVYRKRPKLVATKIRTQLTGYMPITSHVRAQRREEERLIRDNFSCLPGLDLNNQYAQLKEETLDDMGMVYVPPRGSKRTRRRKGLPQRTSPKKIKSWLPVSSGGIPLYSKAYDSDPSSSSDESYDEGVSRFWANTTPVNPPKKKEPRMSIEDQHESLIHYHNMIDYLSLQEERISVPLKAVLKRVKTRMPVKIVRHKVYLRGVYLCEDEQLADKRYADRVIAACMQQGLSPQNITYNSIRELIGQYVTEEVSKMIARDVENKIKTIFWTRIIADIVHMIAASLALVRGWDQWDSILHMLSLVGAIGSAIIAVYGLVSLPEDFSQTITACIWSEMAQHLPHIQDSTTNLETPTLTRIPRADEDVLADAMTEAQPNRIEAIQPETIIKICVGVLSVGISVFDIGNKTNIAKNVVLSNNLSKALKQNVTGMQELVEELSHDVFGYTIGRKFSVALTAKEYHEKTISYISKRAADYVCNIPLFYEMKTHFAKVDAYLRTMNCTSSTLTEGERFALTQLRTVHATAETYLLSMKQHLQTQAGRQETLPCILWGLRGAGKTDFCTRYLGPRLAQRKGWLESMYSINFAKEGGHWLPYDGQSMGLYDEFLAAKEKDPMLQHYNQLFSSAPFNLEAADLPHKVQPCQLKTVFLTSNQAYVDLKATLTMGAESGFYSRGMWYHLINIDQTPDATRDNIPRRPDYSNLRFRIYAKAGVADMQPYLQRLSAGFIDNYSESRYRGNGPHIDMDGVTHPEYVPGVHWYKVKDLWIKEFSPDQLIDHIIAQIEVKEQRHIVDRQERAKRLLVELYCDGIGEQEYIEMCNERGILQTEAREYWLGQQPLTVQSLNTQNYYTLFYGPIGTGKTVAARKVAKWIGKLLKMPVVVVTDWARAVPVEVPSIIVTDDVALEEYEYIKYVNACASPSLFINCVNLRCVSSWTRRVAPKSLIEFCQEGKISGPLRWLNNMMFSRQCWTTNMSQMRVGPPTEAYWRRIGLPGYVSYSIGWTTRSVYVDPSYTKAISFENGYIARDMREGGMIYTTNELARDIAAGYVPLLENVEKVQLLEVSGSEMEILALGQGDVVITAPDVDTLVTFVNSPYRVISASVRSARAGRMTLDELGCGVTVSERLKTAQYTLDTSMFVLKKVTSKDEVVEMALRTYNTLLFAGPHFTCHLNAGNFQAWCENRLIQYNSNLETREAIYSYAVEDGYLVLRNRVELVARIPLKDYVQLTKTCWSKKCALIPMDALMYLRTNEELINSHPIVQAQLSLHQVIVANVREVQEEVAAFDVLWNNLKSSWVFWVVCALLALCTGTMIYQLIRWIMPSKPKEVVISGIPTFQVYCESMRQSLPAKCEVISEDLSQITARVILQDVESISESDEHSIQDQVEDYLDRNFDLEKELNLVFVYESKGTKGGRERLPIKGRSRLPRLRPELSRRHNKKLAAQREAEKKKEYEQEQLPPSACRTVPSLVVERDVMSQATKRVTDNIVQLHNLSMDMAMYGLVVRSRTVLFPAHLVRDEVKGFTNMLEARYDGPEGQVVCGVKVIYISRAQEIAVGQLDSSSRQFKDITPMFVPEHRCKSITHARFIRHGQHDTITPVTVTYLDRPVYQRPERVDRDGYITVDVKGPIYRAVFGQAGKTTREGDCGQVYIADTGQPYVIGMHYAGHAVHPISALVSLTQEVVLELCDVYVPEAKRTVDPLVPFTESNILNKTGVPQVIYESLNEEVLEAAKVAPPSVCDVFLPTPKLPTRGSGSQIEYIGYTQLYTRSWGGKTSYTPSLYTLHSTIPNMVRPSILDPKNVLDPSKLVVDTRGEPSIIWTQVNKYNDPIPISQRMVDMLPEVETEVKDYYLSLYSSPAHRILDDKEITNGLVFKHDELWGELGSLDFDASAGWWAATHLGAHTKKQVYRKDPVLTRAYSEASRGRDLYSYQEDNIGIKMAQRREDKIEQAQKGIRVVHVSKDNLKDELLPNKKSESGRARLFVASDDADVALCRKYFGTMMAVMKKRHSIGHCQVGIDPHTEWHSLYQRLSITSEYGEAGDFSAWDKHLLLKIIRMALRVMVHVVTYNMTEEEKAEYMRVLSVILQDVCMAMSFCDGVFYVRKRGSGSGHPLTSILNSVVNDLYRVIVLKIAIKQWRENHPSRMPELTAKLACILLYTDWATYGDDIISVIDPRLLDILNFRVFARIYQDHLGITYTSPDKSDNQYSWKMLDEMSFLSRTFNVQREKVVVGMLKLESFSGMFHWTTKDTYDQYVAILNSLYSEIVLADEKWYHQLSQEYFAFMNKVYKRFGRRPPCKPMPSYVDNLRERTRDAYNNMWEIPPS